MPDALREPAEDPVPQPDLRRASAGSVGASGGRGTGAAMISPEPASAGFGVCHFEAVTVPSVTGRKLSILTEIVLSATATRRLRRWT